MSGLQENEMLLNTQNLVHRQDANKEDEEESEELRELKIDSGEEDQDELQER